MEKLRDFCLFNTQLEMAVIITFKEKKYNKMKFKKHQKMISIQ